MIISSPSARAFVRVLNKRNFLVLFGDRKNSFFQQQDCDHHHHRNQMHDPPRVSRLLHGFGGETGKEVETVLSEVHDEKESGEYEKRRRKRAAPLPDEKPETEKEKQQPVAEEEGVQKNGDQSFALPTELCKGVNGFGVSKL